MGDNPMAPEVAVKLARTAEERELFARLCYETYVAEMNMFSSVADHLARRLGDANDERSELLIAYADGQPAGVMRLTFGAAGPFPADFLDAYGMDDFLPVVSRPAMMVLTRFVVRRVHRRTAVPFGLITEAARIGAGRGIELAFCDCQPHLINLYLSIGFRPYRRTYNDQHFGLMVPLVFIAGDGDYLRQVGSPLLGAVIDPAAPTSELARRVAGMLPSPPPVRSLERVRDYDWSAEIDTAVTGQALRVFQGLDDCQLAEVLAHSHIIDVAPGDYLIRQGQVTRTMYVLLGGELQYWPGQRHRADAEVGEVVGDVAFLLKTSRTIDVIAGPGRRARAEPQRARAADGHGVALPGSSHPPAQPVPDARRARRRTVLRNPAGLTDVTCSGASAMSAASTTITCHRRSADPARNGSGPSSSAVSPGAATDPPPRHPGPMPRMLLPAATAGI